VHRGTSFFDVINQWPAERPKEWVGFVNGDEIESELQNCDQPHNAAVHSEDWMLKTSKQLGLTLTPRARPKVA